MAKTKFVRLNPANVLAHFKNILLFYWVRHFGDTSSIIVVIRRKLKCNDAEANVLNQNF